MDFPPPLPVSIGVASMADPPGPVVLVPFS